VFKPFKNIKTIKGKPTVLGYIKIGGKGELKPKRGGGEYRMPAKFDEFKIT